MSKDASDLIDLAALPDEPALLKQLLVDRETLLHRVREEAAQQIERLQAERQAAIDAAVKAAVAAILRRYYGPRSETFDPRQLLLFGQRIEALPLDEASVAEEAGEQLVTRRVKNRDQHGRQQLPECLERIEIEHDLDDKACPACGGQRSRIGVEVSEPEPVGLCGDE